MKIRQKHLVLLLGIALIPVGIVSILYARSMSKTGRHLAEQTRQILIDHAKLHLRTLVDDFGSMVRRDKVALELALSRQVQEVERRLAEAPPATPQLFFSQDYDNKTHLPDDIQLTNKYQKLVEGKDVQIPLSFDQQVFFVVRGTPLDAVSDDLARLSTMPEVYWELYQTNPKLMTWLYTALEVGFHSSYPGHGGYPAEYDPRVRLWYTQAKAQGGMTWTLLPDVSTRKVTLTVSAPVKRPDGAFAGTTAIDIDLARILNLSSLPESWKGSSIVLHVQPDLPDYQLTEKLLIIAQQSYIAEGERWTKPPEQEFLDSADTDELEAMRKDIIAGKSGVRRMTYKGADSFWAYNPWREGDPLVVVIVPYEQVVAAAAQTARFISSETAEALKSIGTVLIAVLCAVVIAAIISATSLTRPLYKLVRAAKELANGNFDARVDIRTHDELGVLGDTFNDVGPKLREHQRMKHSLELAMEVQQHLLPHEPPRMEGFDIAGKSVPCDETGGDYYDFIDLLELGPKKLGIALGDVTGHGIGAALLMASARSALRNQVAYQGAALDVLFDKLNVSMLRDTGEARFITLFYALLDGQTRTLHWASGGHDPAFWLRDESGSIEELSEPRGVPLGIIENTQYRQSNPVSLHPGDIVMVGTDGIWEAMNDEDEQFGKERLKGIISQGANDSAQDICDSVVRAVHEFQGNHPQEDDITLVVIKVCRSDQL